MSIKTIILTALASLLIMTSGFSQEAVDSTKAAKEKSRPVRSPFENNLLLDQQTTITNSANTLEMVIQHRFGNLNSGSFDLLGIYGPSNIRIGLNYSFTDWLQVGIGTSKNKLIQDLNWKWAIFRQTMSNSKPVAITYYGNVSMETLEAENYQKFSHRITYYHNLMVSRKFNSMFTFQVDMSFAHFNVVDSSTFIPQGETEPRKHDRNHDNIGVGALGSIKISPQSSIILGYNQLLTMPNVDRSKPGLSLGFEVSTGSHVFQITAGSYRAIVPQYNLVYNTNDFTNKDIALGFNITRLWHF